MRIDPGAATPLYQQVAADLRGQIVDGRLPVGERLPPHRELARVYGVSLITINKALSGLVSEGVLHSRVGRGTFVAVRPAPVGHSRPAGDGAAAPGGTLGFVLRDLGSPFFSRVAHAAEQRAHALGYGLLVLSSGDVLEREETQIRRLLEVGVEGLVIVSMSRTYRLSDPVQALHDRGFPYVMVSYTAGDHVPFVGTDLEGAGLLVGRHLLGLGRRRLGYVSDTFGSLAGELRSRGYRRAAREAGRPVDDALVFEYPYEREWNDYRSGYAVGEHVAGLQEPPDAMFCFNDLGALGLLDALLDRGVRVPEDIAVVGLDDIPAAARARMPLSTVRQATDRIGALAVETIVARLRGETPPPPVRRLLDPVLIVRRTCGAPPGARTLESPPVRERPRRLRSLAEHGAALAEPP